MKLCIYTDGSSRPKTTLAAGWGFIAILNDMHIERYGHLPPPSTNNIAELMAVIKALELFDKRKFDIVIYTDSQYVTKGISEWIYIWKRNNWIASNKKPVKNKDLWLQLDELVQRNSVRFEWVRGHNGNEFNEIADKLANMGSENI